jgi:hypothetical protein
MNGIIQYVVYLITGFWFFLVMVPVITYGTGVRIWGLPLVFCPFLLAGYASGLSFLLPRLAAIIAAIIASGFLLAGISGAFTSQPANLIVPAVIILLVSAFAIREAEESLWKRCQVFGKIILGVFAGVPALFATRALVSIAGWVFGFGGG